MLEALQDIEIASKIVGFDNDDSLDEKYQRLGCDIAPLPHASEDYKLIKHHLLNIHALTHSGWSLELEEVFAFSGLDWSLELEEVFALDRRGELDTYHTDKSSKIRCPCGTGLRIAPLEAPATGYMFGKGIYFAGPVSKSAQYCYVDKKVLVGLLLLSRLRWVRCMSSRKSHTWRNRRKESTPLGGLARTLPKRLEFVKWKEDVVVPCGKPVHSLS